MRVTPDEGMRLYRESDLPATVIQYSPEDHMEEMRDIATGCIAVLLQEELPSISAPMLGSRIPLIVTYPEGDLIRMFVDPQIQKDGDHRMIAAFAYTGELMLLDTKELAEYVPGIPALVRELDIHSDLFAYLRT